MDLNTYENNKYKRENSASWLFHFNLSSFPMRWHHYVEIIYALQDDVLFEVNGEKWLLAAGEILFIWPGELHAILKCHPDDMIIWQFDANLITERIDFKDYAYLFYGTRILRKNEFPVLVKSWVKFLSASIK